ncbi:Hypothetical protein I595_277 [Croceitalea dokdonensis DOKDO 023]|uniref:Outer membrane protein beta-barrel domain-containing protein n=1 Tax=Croceitalea dokdonensis DOKDO 023 TaxID=1300341 RepID=A0A0P7B261_9FLAO|nr:hypothetical protein [Croceitalea dokdonensis]KPM33374.1 Hypothetical protein I595_277 [Croceitalea dokdonensis DOKDO 023]
MKWFIIVPFCLAFNLLQAQFLYTEIGQTISSFDYQNSAGGTLENLQSKSNSYLKAGYQFQLPGDKLSIALGGVLANYGAVASDALLDNYFAWDVTYAGIQTGLSYAFARSRAFEFFLQPTVSLEYLVRGTQTLNNQVFDLTGENEFDNMLLVPRIGVGIQYPISNKAALFLSYHFGRSYSLVNANPEDNEKLSINMHNIGIGLIIQLPGCNCAFNNF